MFDVPLKLKYIVTISSFYIYMYKILVLGFQLDIVIFYVYVSLPMLHI